MNPKNLSNLRMASGLSGAILIGFSMLAFSISASAQTGTGGAPPIPNQGAPALDTPFKTIPRPVIGALREAYKDLPQIENFEVIGHTNVSNPGDNRPRGRNGPTAIQNNCMYVGNRIGRRTGTGPAFGTPALPPEVAILNIANPAAPRTWGHFTTPPGSTSREMRTIPDRNTLIILNFEDGVTGTPGSSINSLQIYDVSNCRNPVLTQTVDLGEEVGHEFFVWRDPNNSGRFLIYLSMLSHDPSLRVFALTNPPRGTFSATPVATFSLAPAVPLSEPTDRDRYRDDHFRFTTKPTSQSNGLHSMTVSDDGTRVYMSDSQAGDYIVDSSNLAVAGTMCIPNTVTMDALTNTDPSLCLRKINPDPAAGRFDVTPPMGGIHHSFLPVPGRPNPRTGLPQYGITSGERNGTTTCPWTPGQILDLTDEMNPVVLSRFMLPENLPENCFAGGPGDPNLQREFSTHQSLVLPNLLFLTWYSGGFRAWDISNTSLPMEVGVFVPRPARNVVELFRQSRDVWMWPFPILHNGLLYTMDESSGLYVLRYTGPRASEIPQQGTWMSNTNYLRAGQP